MISSDKEINKTEVIKEINLFAMHNSAFTNLANIKELTYQTNIWTYTPSFYESLSERCRDKNSNYEILAHVNS